MVTVSYYGGPGANPPFNIFAALKAWLSPHEAVVPQQEIFTPGQTQQQVFQQDTEQMLNSQQTAQAAALCQLGIGFGIKDTITGTVRSVPGLGRLPAYGVLHRGDVVTAVDGKPVTCKASAASMIGAVATGTPVTLTVMRHGLIRKFSLTTVDNKGQPLIGVNIVESFTFPFKVKINIGNIGGPSAGMMFALAIIDKLTPANLADGRFIAGTGEIEVNGTVDPIGGIQQKMAGARAAGATVFLAPAANCPDAAQAIPPGLRVIKVSTLSGAIAALRALKSGGAVPSC
jgi:PDZ domain-containing protein